jgi:sortase A
MRSRSWLEYGAWLIGFVLLVTYAFIRTRSEQASEAAIERFRTTQEVSAPASSHREVSTIDQSLWSARRIAAFDATRGQHGSPQGILRIPAVNLEVPVFEGTSETNLNSGAGRIEGTAALGTRGNVGIAAHRDGFFRNLKDVAAGQWLYLDTAAQTFRYRVVDTRVVSPADVSVLAQTPDWTLTLVTCYPFYFVGSAPQRFIVRAKLQSEQTSSEHLAQSEHPVQ